jgi:hypothetical protein
MVMSFDFRMRSQPSPSVAYQPMLADVPALYQVNNRGMDMIYRALSVAKILDEECKRPDFDATFPDWFSPSRVDDIMDALESDEEPDPPMTAEEKEAVKQAEVSQEALLETRSPKQGMVPAFKFGSNDGWVVTDEECAIVCTALERMLADDQQRTSACPTDEARALIEHWLEYVRVAQGTGGFAVH